MRFLPALAALLLAGCAYTGDPLPPLANIPARVADLAAVQRGSRILVTFSAPRLTTEGVAIRRTPAFDLRIGPAAAPFDEHAWAAAARPVPAVEIENFVARYQIPSADFTNREVVIAVKAIGSNGKDAGWSNFVVLPVLPPPQQPRDLRARSVAGGVGLEWSAAGPRFRVYRRQGEGEGEFALVATVQVPRSTDTAAEPGKPYTYRVQTVVPFGDGKEAESDLSAEVRIVPEDRFPPAPPAGLTALGSPASIELTWDANSEPDLAGYRLYRAAPGEDFRKIADSAGIPSFSDRAVQPGTNYRYAVSAIDRTGNESPRSAPVEASLP